MEPVTPADVIIFVRKPMKKAAVADQSTTII
jgi:hypothetical protein